MFLVCARFQHVCTLLSIELCKNRYIEVECIYEHYEKLLRFVHFFLFLPPPSPLFIALVLCRVIIFQNYADYYILMSQKIRIVIIR